MPFAPGLSFNEIYVSIITANRSASFTAESDGSVIESKLAYRVQENKQNNRQMVKILHITALPVRIAFFTIIVDNFIADKIFGVRG